LAPLADDDVFAWASKLMYGNVYRDAFRFMDRANPAAGMLADEESTRELGMIHLFL
jgi:hypothetical protein